MMEYLSISTQVLLDSTAMYLLNSIVIFNKIKSDTQSFLWLVSFFIFCLVSNFSFIASESIQFGGIHLQNTDILPVNSLGMLLFLLLAVVILNSSFFKLDNAEAIYVTVISFMVWVIIRLLSVMVAGLFTQNPYMDQLFTLLLVILLLFTPIPSLLKVFHEKSFHAKILLLSSFLALIFILMVTRFNQDLVSQHAWVVSLVLIFIISLNFWVLHVQRKQIDQEKRLAVIEQYIPVIDDLVAEMRATQHEFNNKLLAISSIAETEQDVQLIRDKIGKYIQRAGPKPAAQQLLSIDHKVISGFLYSKMKVAKWKNIKVNTDIRTDFNGFLSNEYDWIEVLGILLDNAIEAALPTQEINVTMKNSQEMLELSVSNPGDYKTINEFTKMFEKGYTTKSAEMAHHGYGLFALKQLTDQYGGKIITKNEEYHGTNYITIGVLLP